MTGRYRYLVLVALLLLPNSSRSTNGDSVKRRHPHPFQPSRNNHTSIKEPNVKNSNSITTTPVPTPTPTPTPTPSGIDPYNEKGPNSRMSRHRYGRRVELLAQKKWQQIFQEIKALVPDTLTSFENRSNSNTNLSISSSEMPSATASLLPTTLWSRNLRNTTNMINAAGFTSTGWFNQWKLFLKEEADFDYDAIHPNNSSLRQRFDGFATWEILLQRWTEDAADYLANFSSTSTSTTTASMIATTTWTHDTTVTTTTAATDTETTAPTSSSHTNTSFDSMETTSSSEATTITTRDKYRFKPKPAKVGEPVLPHTDISDKTKNIWIVTTAALPWMTGTAVNPLLRAAYLCEARAKFDNQNQIHNSPTKPSGGNVTLMIPWLERPADRDRLYGTKHTFQTSEEQGEYIRSWLRHTANMTIAADRLVIAWYIGWLEPLENSVYSMGDITGSIPVDQADICILEEPEHLNWYRAPGESWTKKFKYVIGIVHTNYFVYAQDQPAALIRAPALRLLCSWMCRAHCHRLIKLSGTLGSFAPEKELVENVHGVRQTFLDYGSHLSNVLMDPQQAKTHPIFGSEASPTIYFIGKMLWSKGIGSLMELLMYAEESAGLKLKVDMYGGGPDKDEAEIRSNKLELDMKFHGPIDHSALASTHKIFVNPSTSEVLCTTVAEALAMGKFVVVPSHPSNDFFAQFPNTLTYANKEEFVGNIYYALTHSPEPLTKEYSHALSWYAAMERLEAAGCITVAESEAMNNAIASAEAAIEIDLPPLIEDEARRKQISQTVKRTRDRFRQFRSKLSQEIRQSNVLPKELQNRLVAELDKRLDVDLETLLESPKLKIQLSPAELDKQLLELYNKLSEGPSGDVLRVIGGGVNVGRQNYYLKQQALKRDMGKSMDDWYRGRFLSGLPQFLDGDEPTATIWVKRALRRNLLPKKEGGDSSMTSQTPRPGKKKGSGGTRMCIMGNSQGLKDNNCFRMASLSSRHSFMSTSLHRVGRFIPLI